MGTQSLSDKVLDAFEPSHEPLDAKWKQRQRAGKKRVLIRDLTVSSPQTAILAGTMSTAEYSSHASMLTHRHYAEDKFLKYVVHPS